MSRAGKVSILTMGFAMLIGTGACTMQGPTIRFLHYQAYDPSAGKFVKLNHPLFSSRATRTGLIRPERFNSSLGFAIYTTSPHDPGRVPVLLVHGLGSGPRTFEHAVTRLDTDRFEPWYAFYATGASVDESASLLRQSLASLSAETGAEQVILVGYSIGALVVRRAMDPRDDGVVMPHVPAVVGLSAPWEGTVAVNLGKAYGVMLPSFEDMDPGSPLIETLFDRALPYDTELHFFYGLGGDSDMIPGPDDGIVTQASLERPEAMVEAAGIHFFPDATHHDIVETSEPVDRLNDVLVEVVERTE